ncbi:hypothetical protein ACFLX7_00385 [Chloroflexota bacterium]
MFILKRTPRFLLLVCILLTALSGSVMACTTDQIGQDSTTYTKGDIFALVNEQVSQCESGTSVKWAADLLEEGKWQVIRECGNTVRNNRGAQEFRVLSHEEWYYYVDTGELLGQ